MLYESLVKLEKIRALHLRDLNRLILDRVTP